jgi:hypothetical protein
MRKYCAYITENKLNNKGYVGMHFEGKKNYLGSDPQLLSDMKTLGRENFRKTILGTFDTWQECHYWEGFYIRTLQTHVSFGGYNKTWTGGSYTPVPHNKGKKTPINIVERGASKRRGMKRTPEQCKRISDSLTGIPSKRKGIKRTQEEIEKIREGTKKAMASIEIRNKISEGVKKACLKGIKQPLVECPYCGKIGGKSLMKRYHLKKCKHYVQ